MRSINRNLYPSTGYVFTDTDGTRHSAEGWKSLEKKVIAYRSRNGREAGDVMQEIMDQICALMPSYCNDDSPRPALPPRSVNSGTRSGLAGRVLAWVGWVLKERRDKRLVKVSRAESSRRAKICAACPMQAPLNSGCSTCSGTIATARKSIMAGEPFADPKLEGCVVLVEDTRLSVHLELVPVTTPVPGYCWRRAV